MKKRYAFSHFNLNIQIKFLYKHFSFHSAFSWDPNDIRLAVCAGNNKLYMWSMAGCLAVEVPGEGSFIFSVVFVYKFFCWDIF